MRKTFAFDNVCTDHFRGNGQESYDTFGTYALAERRCLL